MVLPVPREVCPSAQTTETSSSPQGSPSSSARGPVWTKSLGARSGVRTRGCVSRFMLLRLIFRYRNVVKRAKRRLMRCSSCSSFVVPFLIATNPVNYGKPWRLVDLRLQSIQVPQPDIFISVFVSPFLSACPELRRSPRCLLLHHRLPR